MANARRDLILATGLLVASGCGRVSDTKELSLAHFFPVDHTLTEAVFTPLGERLAELSDGKLIVRTFPAGALNSSPSAQYSILRNGVADIALVLPAYTPDLFPRTDLLGYPGVCKIPIECTEALRRAWPAIEREYEAKVLGMWSISAPVLLTRDRPVRVLEDMRGLKIRVWSRSAVPFVEALGASAVMQPATVIHQSLSTGVIDGIAIAPSGIVSFRLHEPAAYLTDWLPASGMAFVLLMNQETFDGLSAEERGWIDEAADASLSDAGAAAMARTDADGFRMAEAAGVEIISLSESERRRFERAVASVRIAGLARQMGDMAAGEVIRLFGARP